MGERAGIDRRLGSAVCSVIMNLDRWELVSIKLQFSNMDNRSASLSRETMNSAKMGVWQTSEGVKIRIE